MTFYRICARLLLEICRYTYAAGFNDQKNDADKQDALKWIKGTDEILTSEPIMLHGSATSVASVVPYADRNIVAYMGTKTQFDTFENAISSIEDWHANIKTLQVPFRLTSEQLGVGHPQNIDKDNLGGKVHRGFLEQLAEIQEQVTTTLMAYGGRDKQVIVTGHSQGGAEAALATRALLAGGFPVVSTYTFAAPRAGDIAFAQSVPETVPVHRIEFGDDIVPHVPPILIKEESKGLIKLLKLLPGLSKEASRVLDFLQMAGEGSGFVGLGKLCYGSNKTKALRIDLSADQEAGLFYDRLWSLARHPEHWAEHHHLAGTSEDVKNGMKGNYTALISDFQIVL